MQDNQGQQKPQSFERFEDAMKVILAVPKEDVVKQEKADFIQRQKAKKAKGISDAK